MRLPGDGERTLLLVRGRVVAESGRCVQCGICEHNCPMGVSIRLYSRIGAAVADPGCIRCGSCVGHCPRHTLRFELD